MIKAGKLDRQIAIERQTESVSASGSVAKTWATYATVRAQLVQRSGGEFLAGFGEIEAGGAVFRIRYLSGLTTADRVVFESVAYDIDEIAELGRKRGLELHCTRLTA